MEKRYLVMQGLHVSKRKSENKFEYCGAFSVSKADGRKWNRL